MLIVISLLGTSLAGGPEPSVERVPISIDKGHLTLIASSPYTYGDTEYDWWRDDIDSVTVTNESNAPITLEAEIKGDGFVFVADGGVEHTTELMPGEWITLVVAYELPEEQDEPDPVISFASEVGVITLTALNESGAEVYSNDIVLEANVMTMPDIPSFDELVEAEE